MQKTRDIISKPRTVSVVLEKVNDPVVDIVWYFRSGAFVEQFAVSDGVKCLGKVDDVDNDAELFSSKIVTVWLS